MNNNRIFILSATLFLAALIGIFYYMGGLPSNGGQMNIAVADINRLLAESDMGKDLTEKISDIGKNFSEEYAKAFESLGEMQSSLKDQKSVMSDKEYEDAQLNIFSAQSNLRKLANEFQNSTMEIFNRMTQHIAEEVSDMLPELMTEYNFSLLFRTEQQNIYFNKSLNNMQDITSKVKSKLDDISNESPVDLSRAADQWKEKIQEIIEKTKQGEFTKAGQ